MVTRIGIVGGGQLGRMLTLAAHPLGLPVTVLDPSPGCPAAQAGAAQLVGDIRDGDAIRRLAADVDVVTWEVEHIDAATLVSLASSGTVVHPSPVGLAAVQDKFAQKQLVASRGVEVPAFAPFPASPSQPALDSLFEQLGRPVMVKARRGGFDGRGNALFDGDLDELAAALGTSWADLYAEALVPFDAELAVVVAVGASGEASYPVIRTTQADSICHTAVVPAGVPPALVEAADTLGRSVASAIGGWGVFAIECFAVGERLVFNEVAPRVHNSGHLTIEAFATSQFEQHIRAVAGLPLGAVTPRAPAAAMVNVLGRSSSSSGGSLAAALAPPDVHVHLYGKRSRPGRKIGHVTALGASADEALARASEARDRLPV